MRKIWSFFKKVLLFVLNPRLLLCLGIGWIITNGWSYIILALGTFLDIKWMIAVGGGYVAFLWFPMSPEKIATVAIAIALLRILFPNDTKTLGVLKQLNHKVKAEYMKIANKRNKTLKNPIDINGASLYKFGENIYKLEVPFFNIYTAVYIVKNGKNAFIIDCADSTLDAQNYILPTLKEIGVENEWVKGIFLTHGHGDHIGGLPLILKECKNAKIYGFARPNIEFPEDRFYSVCDGEIIEENIKVLLLEGHDKLNGGYLYLPSKTLFSGDSIELYGLDVYGLLVRHPKLYFESLLRLKKEKINNIFAAHNLVPLGSEAIGRRASKRYIKCAKECLLDMVDFAKMRCKEGVTETAEIMALFVKERSKIYKNFPTANFEIIIEAVKREYM